jgi:hypothetical protein
MPLPVDRNGAVNELATVRLFIEYFQHRATESHRSWVDVCLKACRKASKRGSDGYQIIIQFLTHHREIDDLIRYGYLHISKNTESAWLGELEHFIEQKELAIRHSGKYRVGDDFIGCCVCPRPAIYYYKIIDVKRSQYTGRLPGHDGTWYTSTCIAHAIADGSTRFSTVDVTLGEFIAFHVMVS